MGREANSIRRGWDTWFELRPTCVVCEGKVTTEVDVDVWACGRDENQFFASNVVSTKIIFRPMKTILDCGS